MIKINVSIFFQVPRGVDRITSPKLVLCDEILRPVMKLPALKTLKKHKGSKFGEDVFDDKVITLFLRLK
jgi:hypothetical protein